MTEYDMVARYAAKHIDGPGFLCWLLPELAAEWNAPQPVAYAWLRFAGRRDA